MTRLPSGSRASQIGLEFIDATTDLADDALADIHQLSTIGEAHIARVNFALDLDVGRVTAIHHYVGDLVASEQRLERSVAEDIITDVSYQLVLLDDGHHHVADRENFADDFANLLFSLLRIEFRQLCQVDRVDQHVKNGGFYVVILLGPFGLDRLAFSLDGWRADGRLGFWAGGQ